MIVRVRTLSPPFPSLFPFPSYPFYPSRYPLPLFSNRIHKNMIKDFKHALVWGLSAKHKPQRVGKDHLLDDEDVVQVVKKI